MAIKSTHTFYVFFVIKDCIFLPDLNQCIWDHIWEPHLSYAQAHARAHARVDTFCKLAAHECNDRCTHRQPSGYVRDCIILDWLLVLTQQKSKSDVREIDLVNVFFCVMFGVMNVALSRASLQYFYMLRRHMVLICRKCVSSDF